MNARWVLTALATNADLIERAKEVEGPVRLSGEMERG
jgi:hypothetical protein